MLSDAPPAYQATPHPARTPPKLDALPSHLLLRILAHLSLPDLVLALRPASRALYVHAMSLARMQGLPLWHDEVRAAAAQRAQGGAPLGSSDPLGAALQDPGADAAPSPAYTTAATATPTSSSSPLSTRSRELAVLDLFLVALSTSLARLGASSLLFTSEDDALRLVPGEKRADLWNLLQPRARCEDLLAASLAAAAAARAGAGRGGQGAGRDAAGAVRGEDVRVELRAREARVLLPFRSGGGRETWKGVASVARDSSEPVEALVERLSYELERAAVQRRTDGLSRWYEARAQ
ncbi:hypothetical protein JCM3775_007351 [Rhodotorula graminis]|uniref:F-box domain-containing protein n=1 Tax=Rhodotorula graminis (strain WP1) TaxID=578459 RepID=A0A194S2W2_RHOGW|nr:uncharacterized protein RHOBADRAFT_44589 [Rhodotorula graminis WP1]KPV75073.1 hypothetical protein RHOBADRAFT_44589 [Rhodotorula graminis WP1]